jgi:hypothetical protein
MCSPSGSSAREVWAIVIPCRLGTITLAWAAGAIVGATRSVSTGAAVGVSTGSWATIGGGTLVGAGPSSISITGPVATVAVGATSPLIAGSTGATGVCAAGSPLPNVRNPVQRRALSAAAPSSTTTTVGTRLPRVSIRLGGAVFGTGAGGAAAPSRQERIAWAKAPTDGQRRVGSLASARRTMASTSAGVPGATREGRGGASLRCRMATPTGVSARNGSWPVSISNATTPAE